MWVSGFPMGFIGFEVDELINVPKQQVIKWKTQMEHGKQQSGMSLETTQSKNMIKLYYAYHLNA